jgi:CheY-like chemotaxis protein
MERLDMLSASPRVIPAETNKLIGRILLAEDGIDNQKLIAFHLKKAGAEVDIAENGSIALQKILASTLEGKQYNLLLTDMQMPEMDGYTLASTLRQQGFCISIVALTAHAMAEDRARCLNAGCDDYATKPINKTKLIEVCQNWLGKTSSKGLKASAIATPLEQAPSFGGASISRV